MLVHRPTFPYLVTRHFTRHFSQLVSCHPKSLSFLPDWFRSTWQEATLDPRWLWQTCDGPWKQACHLSNMVCMTFCLVIGMVSPESYINRKSVVISSPTVQQCLVALSPDLSEIKWTTLKYLSGKYTSHHPQQFGRLVVPTLDKKWRV